MTTDLEAQGNESQQPEEEDWRKKKYRPPIDPTSLTPYEIIGDDIIAHFEEHFKAVRFEVDEDRFSAKVKKLGLSSKERKELIAAYERLREKGIFPADVDKNGNVTFKYAVRSDLQDYVESLPTIDRKNFPLSVHFKPVPDVEEHEYGE